MEEIRDLSNKEDNNNIEQVLRKRIRMQIIVLIVSVLVVLILVFAMTAAWFTNVAKTSDLVFQTESWGFEEEKITLSESDISISPGKSGIIPLTVDNSDASESVQIGVTISKTSTQSEMDEELQKRLFFYVEKDIAIEEEQLDKVYLSTSAPHSYTYTILPGQQLVMNEIYYNDFPMKWEWVYDMLGYYFRGTVNKNTEENKVQIDEYVRPIEYDYEKAIFDVDESSETYQQLLAVGTIDTKDFLEDISQQDGYKGKIDVSEAVVIDEKVYYPVEVDNKGYGMWAYLCTLEEVEEGIDYDSGLAEAEEALNATATIIITAHSVPAKATEVNTESALKDALLDETVDIVSLGTDILSGSTFVFESGSKVIDLNGYTIQYSGTETEYDFISVAEGATLTLIDGQIEGTSQASTFGAFKINAFEMIAGNLILSNVNVSGFDSAVCVEDMSAETAGDSVIQIANCNLEGKQAALFLQGNGAATDAVTKVMINNSRLKGEYYAGITGQGNDDRWGTELILSDSEIEGYYAGMYQPQRSSLTVVHGCKVKGNTSIAVKGGTVNIYNSEIIGTGEVDVQDAAAAGSGFADTGDGVYVEAVYNWPVTVNLRGEETIVKSLKSYGVELFGQEDVGAGKVTIYEGNYEGLKGSARWNGIGKFEIFGGNYEGAVSDGIEKY